jgi:hypothetical protein
MMIIGMILDIGAYNSGEPSGQTQNGAAMMQFYNYQDAINWALDTSRNAPTGTAGASIRCMTMTYNCNTQERRWWFNGVEYTG